MTVPNTFVNGTPADADQVNESFNAVFRDGCLNRWLSESVREAREALEYWLHEYNHERPHGALGGLAPFVFFKHGNHQPQEQEAA
ncbi:MAG: transposase [bacterium]|nr:transposase [bacterium]MCP4741349.1 transposase [Actinomycetales bacterium]MDP6074613.1 transposase [Myxococcota bacterium]MDP7297743.1 transposase [Myxococcota bacterium]